MRSGLIRVQRLPFVRRLPQVLRRRVEVVGSSGEKTIGNVHCQRSGSARGRLAGEEARIDLNVAILAGAPVEARQERALAARVEDVGVRRVGRDVAALAAADVVERVAGWRSLVPRRCAQSRSGRRRWSCPAARRRRGTGKSRRRRDVVDLRGGVALRRPRPARRSPRPLPPPSLLSTIRCGLRSVDPEVVIVAVRRTNVVSKRLAAVVGRGEAHVEHVDAPRVLRIRVDARVVEGALSQLALVVRPASTWRRRRRSGTLHRRVLDDRVDALGVRRRHRHADLADDARRHPGVARELRPRVAAVRGW